MKRAVVVAMANIDAAIDDVLYRPAVVKAFMWMPRWWLCDLARLSIALDDRWGLGYWSQNGIRPGDPCDACGRRASIHMYGGIADDETPTGDYMDTHPAYVCGWCHLHGTMLTEVDVRRELALARAASISWKWRWRPGR